MPSLRAFLCSCQPKPAAVKRPRPASLQKPLPSPPPSSLDHRPAFALRIRAASFPARPSALAAAFPGCALVDGGAYDGPGAAARVCFVVDLAEPEGPRRVKAALLVAAAAPDGRAAAAERGWRGYLECVARQGAVEGCVALLVAGGEARAWRFQKGGGFVEDLSDRFQSVLAELGAGGPAELENRPDAWPPGLPVLRVTGVEGERSELE